MTTVFKLSKRSLERLQGVHLDLVDIVEKAIEITPIDFGIVRGLSTLEEQEVLFNQGRSKTLKSKHLEGLAVDFVPYWDGKPQFENWPYHFHVAEAFNQAAFHCKKQIIWGGAWGVPIGHVAIPPNVLTAQQIYLRRKQKEGKEPFLDGPHIELAGDYGVETRAA